MFSCSTFTNDDVDVLLALQTEFVDEYGDYGGRVQDYDDDGNPTDSDLEDSLDDTEQVSTQP